ncbi:MAG: RNA helicase domain-containing protein [Alistipes senegalensis]|nr:RNA helicase domain-containing protein [Alistipes senegalensis]
MNNNNDVSKSWFLVLNNPKEHFPELVGKSDDDVAQFFCDLWCTSGTRSGAFLFCKSAEGLEHMHMVVEDSISMRFSKIRKTFNNIAHIEPTKGTKKQVEDYINKVGAFAEKGEIVLSRVQKGEIICRMGFRSDLQEIKDMIYSGLTPQNLFDGNPEYYTLANYIERIYYDKIKKETPFSRVNDVYWHFGESGTGKTFSADELINIHGREHVHYCTASDANPFDSYTAQKILFIDELRKTSRFFTYSNLLSICDCRTVDVSARYHNKTMLWQEVHITSPLLPQELFTNLGKYDSIKQILRRIHFYVYHYKDGNEYKKLEIEDNSNKGITRERVKMEVFTQKQKAKFPDFSGYEYVDSLT